MTLQECIQGNRKQLTEYILNNCPNCEIGDEEIEEWIRNDEGLYSWAMSEGVEDI